MNPNEHCDKCGFDANEHKMMLDRLRMRTATAVRLGLDPMTPDDEIEYHEKGARLKASGVKSDNDDTKPEYNRFSGFNKSQLENYSWFDVFCAELLAGIEPKNCSYYDETVDRHWEDDPYTALSAAKRGFEKFKVKVENPAP